MDGYLPARRGRAGGALTNGQVSRYGSQALREIRDAAAGPALFPEAIETMHIGYWRNSSGAAFNG
jgi:hypothetical protein